MVEAGGYGESQVNVEGASWMWMRQMGVSGEGGWDEAFGCRWRRQI